MIKIKFLYKIKIEMDNIQLYLTLFDIINHNIKAIR